MVPPNWQLIWFIDGPGWSPDMLEGVVEVLRDGGSRKSAGSRASICPCGGTGTSAVAASAVSGGTRAAQPAGTPKKQRVRR